MAGKTYDSFLDEVKFVPVENEERFGKLGKYFTLPPGLGKGIYWIYEPNELFNIKIHDFYYNEDQVFDTDLPEGLSVTYYESISGEELSPYKPFYPNTIRTGSGGEKAFRAIIHKNIPIRSTGIEIRPEYYNNYLETNYPGEFSNLENIFRSFIATSNFPEMVSLLNQIKNYKGDGSSARLYYEAKVVEAVSLLVKYQRELSHRKKEKISATAQESIKIVSMYIHDHYADNLNQRTLTRIAGISATKLKDMFKEINGCTITEYIQKCRISQAQHLLQYTDLTVGQIARAVGYNNASRFTELFKRYTGLLPKDYRKL
ncbi:MAG: AraC family transcriptional regulator [Spirochaetales bacterium]|nr:AraC family transcriptional regulator [Spirochaetales bacterium]